MPQINYFLLKGLLLALCLFSSAAMATDSIRVPILTYHNFDPSNPGSMGITTARFEEQLKWLKDNDYTVIPLQELVGYLQGARSSIPEKSVVITADDGRLSVYTYMWPLVRKYNIPVTLFIYPSSISNAKYAMTWEQLKELQKTGQFDIQGHTHWHPNFKQEKKRLSAEGYQKVLDAQFAFAKKVVDGKLGTNITLLAWPFGIYDPHLEDEASKAGYAMAFSIDARHASKEENRMTQPRYMIVAGQSMKTFAAIVTGKIQSKKKS